jgi:hypothetical protein
MIEYSLDNISAFDYRDMRAWCKDQFGLGGWRSVGNKNILERWDSWSKCDNISPHQMMKWRGEVFFDFADDKDYMLFILRWI